MASGERDPIEFWFDFSSPYAYFAAARMPEVAERTGRKVIWRPFLLGHVFKVTGMAPLTGQQLRGTYGLRDWARLARLYGVPFRLPAVFPQSSIRAGRVFYGLGEDTPEAEAFAQRCFLAIFRDGLDLSQEETVASVLKEVDPSRSLETCLASGRERLRTRTDEAVRRGVFGAPFMFVDGEPFWGSDRLDQVVAWSTGGGW